MTNLLNETGGAANVTQISDDNPSGNTFGQSTTDLISFYNVTPITQPASGDVVTQLQNLGLFGTGTFTMTVIPTTNNTASSVSSNSSLAIAASGITKVNSSVAKTFYLAQPVAGYEKFLYCDTPSTAAITIKLNSTEVASSLIILTGTDSQSTLTSASASSLGNIVITNTTANTLGSVTLIAASSVEWVVKGAVSTLITYTT